MQCQCEHANHFSLEERPSTFGVGRTRLGHKYGAEVDSHVVAVRTPWGTFKVCRTCARNCYPDYPSSDGEPPK